MDVTESIANAGSFWFLLGTIGGTWNPQWLPATFRRQLLPTDILDPLWPTLRSFFSDFGFVRTVRHEGFNPVTRYHEHDEIRVVKGDE